MQVWHCYIPSPQRRCNECPTVVAAPLSSLKAIVFPITAFHYFHQNCLPTTTFTDQLRAPDNFAQFCDVCSYTLALHCHAYNIPTDSLLNTTKFHAHAPFRLTTIIFCITRLCQGTNGDSILPSRTGWVPITRICIITVVHHVFDCAI